MPPRSIRRARRPARICRQQLNFQARSEHVDGENKYRDAGECAEHEQANNFFADHDRKFRSTSACEMPPDG
jgi:hypothetical protein